MEFHKDNYFEELLKWEEMIIFENQNTVTAH